MGFFDSLFGNASTVDVKKVEKELEAILIAEEQVEAAFKVFRDLMVFTEKRLILVDKQGVTGKRLNITQSRLKAFHISVSKRQKLLIWMLS